MLILPINIRTIQSIKNVLKMKKIQLVVLLTSISFGAFAQQCLTDKVNFDILKKNAELMKRHMALYQNVPAVSNNKRATKIIIPVVFHVIHTNGPENISKAQIEDQIRILNEDYSFTNPNRTSIRSIFQGVAATMDIEFRLAKIDPNGNCTDGINRVYSSKSVNAGDAVKKLPLARWPNEKYLNIWVVNNINSDGAPGTILGFAYFPSTSSGVTYSNLDGVIVRADYVGSIGTSNASRAGRVLTHEIGHYLGLIHPFQDSCGIDSASAAAGNDHCDDTPPVAGTFTNANCDPNSNSCHNDRPDLPDMFENYMDYSEGHCQAMFTLDQKAIVYNTFATFAHRINLISEANLIATGVVDRVMSPLAGITSTNQMICAGKSVTFYEISCQSPITSRSWTFEGGNISTSTVASPTVTYANPGTYKVTLTVTNAQGSNTITKESYITVLPGEAIDKGYLVEGFENPAFQPADGWTVVKEEGQETFMHDPNVGYKSTSCLVAPISSLDRVGKRYRLISPRVDLRPISGMIPKLSFMCAYSKPNATSHEILRVYTSIDCGNTWVQRYSKQDAALFSTNYATLNYVPTDNSQWKQHSVPLITVQNEANVMFMIEVESDAGGPVYIDNINISQFNTSISELEVNGDLMVYPVPSHDMVNLQFNSAISGVGQMQITNTLGQVVMSQQIDVAEGQQETSVQFANRLSPGIYFIKVSIGNQSFLNKLIIE